MNLYFVSKYSVCNIKAYIINISILLFLQRKMSVWQRLCMARSDGWSDNPKRIYLGEMESRQTFTISKCRQLWDNPVFWLWPRTYKTFSCEYLSKGQYSRFLLSADMITRQPSNDNLNFFCP